MGTISCAIARSSIFNTQRNSYMHKLIDTREIRATYCERIVKALNRPT